MTRCFIFALIAAVFGGVAGCACETTRVAACVETEAIEEFVANVNLEAGIAGPRVDDDGFVSAEGCGPLDHVVTVASDGGRVRFSWNHPEVDLAVDVGSDIAVEQIENGGLESGSGNSFVLRDEGGIAIAVRSGVGASTVGDARVEHGFWRGTSVNICGAFHATGTRITTDAESHDLSSGASVAIDVEGAPMVFHAFSASTAGPVVCTDIQSNLNWVLIRAPS